MTESPAAPLPPSLAPGAEIRLRPRRLLRAILLVAVAVEVLLIVLDYHINYGHLADMDAVRNIFDTTREDGLGSWFSMSQTVLVALLLWVIVIMTGGGRVSRWTRAGWIFLALLFTYMAADDGAMIHERLGTIFTAAEGRRSIAEGEPSALGHLLERFPSYAWQMVVLPFFAVAGLFLVVFLWRVLGDRRGRLLVVAAIACFVVALGLDFVEGLGEGHPSNPFAWAERQYPALNDWTKERFRHSAYSTLRHFQKSVEESIEMFGMTLFGVAFLRYLFRNVSEVDVRVVGSEEEAP